MKRPESRETTDLSETGRTLSKRSKLTGKNVSFEKDLRFYGEEAVSVDKVQGQLDSDEDPFSERNIQKELEKHYEAKRKLKHPTVGHVKREQQFQGEAIDSTDDIFEESKVPSEKNGENDIRLEPFHLLNELEEGSFDDEGAYTYKKDEENTMDNWLEDVDKGQIRKAKEAHEKQMKQLSARELEENRKEINQYSKEDLYKKLLSYMVPFETESLAQVLKRLSKSEDKKEFESVVELAQRLTMLGSYDIYECNYATLESRLDVPGTTTHSPDNQVMWEYYLDDTQKIYGPFQTQLMADWQEQGYFADNLLVRKITGDHIGNFIAISSLEPFSSLLSE